MTGTIAGGDATIRRGQWSMHTPEKRSEMECFAPRRRRRDGEKKITELELNADEPHHINHITISMVLSSKGVHS